MKHNMYSEGFEATTIKDCHFALSLMKVMPCIYNHKDIGYIKYIKRVLRKK